MEAVICRETRNQCEAWENMYAKSCVGKQVTGVKNGKKVTTVTSVRICHLIISAKCKLGNVNET